MGAMTYPHPQNDPYQQGTPQNPQYPQQDPQYQQQPDPLNFQVPTPYPDPYGYQQPQQPPAGYDPNGYPVYNQPYSAPPVTGGPYNPYGQQQYGPPKQNGLALASMITSIAGLALVLCCSVAGLAGAVGAILGHVARKQIRERGEGGAGKALAGIICGWIAFALFFVMIAVALLLPGNDWYRELTTNR